MKGYTMGAAGNRQLVDSALSETCSLWTTEEAACWVGRKECVQSFGADGCEADEDAVWQGLDPAALKRAFSALVPKWTQCTRNRNRPCSLS